MGKFFGTDGARGPAYEGVMELDNIAEAAATYGQMLVEQGYNEAAVGKDPRPSGDDYEDATTSGLRSVGLHVRQLGVLPTPALAYTIASQPELGGGVMLSASHNPPKDQGFKPFDHQGQKLSDDVEAAIEAAMWQPRPLQKRGDVRTDSEAGEAYTSFLVDSAEGHDFGGWRIAADGARGAAAPFIKAVYSGIGAEVTPFFTDMGDGSMINDGCGATDMRALEQLLGAGEHNIGLAHDGDADRCLAAVPGTPEAAAKPGELLFDGDFMIATIAMAAKQRLAPGQKIGVVTTHMTNIGIEQYLAEQDIAMSRADVGDRYVLERMHQLESAHRLDPENNAKYTIGGEQSGHAILLDKLATGDGMLTGIHLMKSVDELGIPLTELHRTLKSRLAPQFLLNMEGVDRTKMGRDGARAIVEKWDERLTGIGRVLIRPSGTQPMVRVLVELLDKEADPEAVANEIGEELRPLLLAS